MSTTTSVIAAARALDQFYTNRHVAAKCIQFVNEYLLAEKLAADLWLEPAAGNGSFLNQLPQPRFGIDLDPKAHNIQHGDFLQWTPAPRAGSIITIGNPPFGRNASLALRFVNHAADFADVVAFILPRTFEKPNFQRKIDRRLWLEASLPLDPDSFTLAGQPRAVPCVFQIWRRRSNERRTDIRTPLTHPDFRFAQSLDDAHFAFRRNGGLAGTCPTDKKSRSAASNYFICDTSPDGRVMARLTAIDWRPIRERTAGIPSIGKGELVAAYSEALRQEQQAKPAAGQTTTTPPPAATGAVARARAVAKTRSHAAAAARTQAVSANNPRRSIYGPSRRSPARQNNDVYRARRIA